MSYFQKSLNENGLIPSGIDARHVEGYIRLAHSTLNSLDWPTIRREVKIALGCIQQGGVGAAESCARSFGL